MSIVDVPIQKSTFLRNAFAEKNRSIYLQFVQHLTHLIQILLLLY